MPNPPVVPIQLTDKDILERKKFNIDVYKHFVTISSASIAVLATFMTKVFSRPLEWRPLGIASLIALLVAVYGFSVTIVFEVIIQKKDMKDEMTQAMMATGFTSSLSFVLGMICLGFFAVKNLLK